MNSKKIVTLFLKNKDNFNIVKLTVKQVNWLMSQLNFEAGNNQKNYPLYDKHHATIVQDINNVSWQLVIWPNGAGFIKPLQEIKELTQNNTMTEEQKQQYTAMAEQWKKEGNIIAAEELLKAINKK